MTLDEFFAGQEKSRQLFATVRRAVEAIGTADLRVSKSQIAFRRRKNFALVWIPGRYLRGPSAPLVLTISFPERSPSPRWKEIVEAAPGRFTHHLELFETVEIDEEVRGWLQVAWKAAA
jgi:hypothetical protein